MLLFIARCYANVVYAIVMSDKTAKRRIMQPMPHDSPDILVICCQRSQQNSNGVTPNWGGGQM